MSLASQSIWLVADRLAMVGSLFATSVIVARGYGPESYGAYLVASAVVQTVVGAIATGADVPFVRAFSRASGHEDRSHLSKRVSRGLATAALVAACVITTAAMMIGGSPLTFFPPDGDTDRLIAGLLIAGLGALPQLPLMVGEWRLRASGRADRIAKLRIPVLFAGLALRVVLASLAAPLSLLVLAIGVEVSVAAATMLFCSTDADRSLSAASGQLVQPRKAFLAEALRQGIASLAVVAFFRVNPILLGAFAGLDQTARYGAALALVLAFDLLTSSISAAAFPRLVSLGRDAEASLPSLLRLGRIYALLAVAFIVLAVVAGEFALGAIYGPAYRDAWPVLITLSVTTLFTSSAAVRSLFINLTGRSGLHLLNAGIGMGALLLCGPWLAARHGALGAALAMVIACATSGLLSSFLFAATRPIGIVQLKSLLLGRLDSR